MLHLFIYCYVGETLLGQVESISSFINRVVQLVFLVFSKKKKKKMEYFGFSEYGYRPIYVPLQLVRFTVEASGFINDRDTPCERVVSNNGWKIQPVLPWIFQRCEWKEKEKKKIPQILWKFQIFNFNQRFPFRYWKHPLDIFPCYWPWKTGWSRENNTKRFASSCLYTIIKKKHSTLIIRR